MEGFRTGPTLGASVTRPSHWVKLVLGFYWKTFDVRCQDLVHNFLSSFLPNLAVHE